MSKRQPPIVRAGSGDSHEARLAVLEQRFSDHMQARCSWCNHVKSAKQGEWIEVVISSPGTGVRPAHVFRCMGCEAAPVSVSGGLVAVPSGARRPGQSPPPLRQDPVAPPRRRASTVAPAGPEPASSARRAQRETAKGRQKRDREESENLVAGAQDQQEGAPSARPTRKRPQAAVFPGTLSPAP